MVRMLEKAHIFRLCCKIPIINLSEPARGFAKMKAVRWIGAEVNATGPWAIGWSDLEIE
jgi:hypothetical protein